VLHDTRQRARGSRARSMTADVAIERATPEDGEAILELLRANTLPVEGALDHLHHALVARCQGRVIGSAALEVYDDGALLRSVAVEATHRGRGVGQQLTAAALELAGTLDFMNVTGPPLKGLLREFQLSPDDLILVHDDLDLEPGRLRIKQAGGHGGHNGIKSVIDALGTPQFVRLKIGIGRPAPGQERSRSTG